MIAPAYLEDGDGCVKCHPLLHAAKAAPQIHHVPVARVILAATQVCGDVVPQLRVLEHLDEDHHEQHEVHHLKPVPEVVEIGARAKVAPLLELPYQKAWGWPANYLAFVWGDGDER